MGLLVLRRVVLGVLGDVAELACLPDAIGDLPALLGREVLDLLLELLVPLGRENDFLQRVVLLTPQGCRAGERGLRRGRMLPPPPDDRQPCLDTMAGSW